MKINRQGLTKIIEEELGEMLRPNMRITPGIPPVRSGELRPPAAAETPAPEMAPEQPDGPIMVEIPIEALQDLYGMIKGEHDVSIADNQTPERVTKSLSRIAGTLAGLL